MSSALRREVSVYNYESPRQFLLERISADQKADPSLSVRSIARKMGLNSHALLVMLMQGKRPFRVKHATALAKGLELPSQERLYLQALIQFDGAEDLDEKKLCSLWLSELNPGRPVLTRELESYEIVSQWIHFAILSVIETHDFDPTPSAIAQRLGPKTNTAEVMAALERMKAAGLIEATAAGSYTLTSQRFTTTDGVANAGARQYHSQVMTLAQDALQSVPLSRREYQAFSISIPDAKISLAQEMIRKFRSQFAQAMGLEPGDEVYQLNIQFFQLTECPSRSRGEDEGVDTNVKSKLSRAGLKKDPQPGQPSLGE